MAINNLPIIRTLDQLQIYRATLRNTLKNGTVPKIPWNFTVTNKQGGNYLTWQAVTGADGYRVDMSQDGSFTDTVTTTLPGNAATAYFDTVPTAQGATPAIRYYRVRATSGTTNKPQSVDGSNTGVVSSTAIAPSNTATASTTSSDTTTTDRSNAQGANGNYRAMGGRTL